MVKSPCIMSVCRAYSNVCAVYFQISRNVSFIKTHRGAGINGSCAAAGREMCTRESSTVTESETHGSRMYRAVSVEEPTMPYAASFLLLVQSAAASFDRTSSRLIRFKPPLITFLTIHYEAQVHACMQNKHLHLFNSDNETRGPPSHQWPRCQRVTTSGRCSG